MTLGLPGFALMLAAIVAWIVTLPPYTQFAAKSRRDSLFAKMASALFLILGVASITDYPLRTPVMMSLIVIAALWISGAAAKRGGTVRDSSLGSDFRD